MLTGCSTPKIISQVLLMVSVVIALAGCITDDKLPGSSSGSITIGGSVGDGPVTGATVTVYSVDGTILGSIVSDSNAKYQTRVKARGQDYPLRLEVNGGIDLVTGRAPDFRMMSVIGHPSVKIANINPFSSLIVQVAEQLPGGLDAANVALAIARVQPFGVDLCSGVRVGGDLDESLLRDFIASVHSANQSCNAAPL